jgi:hypothetical protein
MAQLVSGSTIGGDLIVPKDDNKRVVQLPIFLACSYLVVANGVTYFVVPDELSGMNLIRVSATVITPGVTGVTTISVYNLTDTVDMLSTQMTIDSTEYSTRSAAIPAVIDTAHDDVLTGDVLRIDVRGVSSTTVPKGLIVELVFQTP